MHISIRCNSEVVQSEWNNKYIILSPQQENKKSTKISDFPFWHSKKKLKKKKKTKGMQASLLSQSDYQSTEECKALDTRKTKVKQMKIFCKNNYKWTMQEMIK